MKGTGFHNRHEDAITGGTQSPPSRLAAARRAASPHLLPLLALGALCLAYWSRVVFTGRVLLPGDMLRGFAPFGADARAPWGILQWDALAQYYPWRCFAARQLQAGIWPLWNPHQFSGTPFLANAQSAVFYPLNLPFWLTDVARAFGLSALLHTLLAALATYVLAQRWRLSRSAALLAGVAFGFCGYLAAWVMLPTLSNTASWLPLLILLLERAAAPPRPGASGSAAGHAAGPPVVGPPSAARQSAVVAALPLAMALGCALLAGHAQVLLYLMMALLLRALLLPRRVRAGAVLLCAAVWCVAFTALQVLPTLELARLGPRAAQGGATTAGWEFVRLHALQPGELCSLLVFGWPMAWGSFNESFGYSGAGVVLLCLVALGHAGYRRCFGHRQPANAATEDATTANATVAGAVTANAAGVTSIPVAPVPSGLTFAAVLAGFGLLYALGTPLAQLLYFTVPGLAQMGGVGRALVLWSFGAALLAGHGLDVLRRLWNRNIVTAAGLIVVSGELFAAGWVLLPDAPRETIYPPTGLTTWLQKATRDGSRILLLTPRRSWIPGEGFGLTSGRTHPPGVLPPNGATVYGLNDVSGYDSLALRSYRSFVAQGEGEDVAPPANGNMVLLNNPASPALASLNVRYVVSLEPLDATGLREVHQAAGCFVYALATRRGAAPGLLDGRTFFPGRRNGAPQPDSSTFRFGCFISLCAFMAACGLMAASAVRSISTQRLKPPGEASNGWRWPRSLS